MKAKIEHSLLLEISNTYPDVYNQYKKELKDIVHYLCGQQCHELLDLDKLPLTKEHFYELSKALNNLYLSNINLAHLSKDIVAACISCVLEATTDPFGVSYCIARLYRLKVFSSQQFTFTDALCYLEIFKKTKYHRDIDEALFHLESLDIPVTPIQVYVLLKSPQQNLVINALDQLNTIKDNLQQAPLENAQFCIELVLNNPMRVVDILIVLSKNNFLQIPLIELKKLITKLYPHPCVHTLFLLNKLDIPYNIEKISEITKHVNLPVLNDDLESLIHIKNDLPHGIISAWSELIFILTNIKNSSSLLMKLNTCIEFQTELLFDESVATSDSILPILHICRLFDNKNLWDMLIRHIKNKPSFTEVREINNCIQVMQNTITPNQLKFILDSTDKITLVKLLNSVLRLFKPLSPYFVTKCLQSCFEDQDDFNNVLDVLVNLLHSGVIFIIERELYLSEEPHHIHFKSLLYCLHALGELFTIDIMRFIIAHRDLPNLAIGLKTLQNIKKVTPIEIFQACTNTVIRTQNKPQKIAYTLTMLQQENKLAACLKEQIGTAHKEYNIGLSEEQLGKTCLVNSNKYSLRFFFKDYPKVNTAYKHANEKGKNPAYHELDIGEPQLPTNEKRIFVLTTELKLIIGIKNAYSDKGNTPLSKLVGSKNINPQDRYGHPSLALPNEYYDGGVYYAGWLYQHTNHLQVYLWSGRYNNAKLTNQQKQRLELYITQRLVKAYGQQEIHFIDWNRTEEESDSFLKGNLFSTRSNARIYAKQQTENNENNTEQLIINN